MTALPENIALPKKTRILIIHQNFPGQFRFLAQHLAERPDVEVLGLGREGAPGLAGFPWFRYKLHRQSRKDTHPYLTQMESAVLHGQAVARALQALQRKGFTPDVILAHPGWGETLYAKEIFPAARLVHFCEWYYSSTGADSGFDPEFPQSLDGKLRINTWNAQHLLNLQNCDAAITPTHWQKSRFPDAYQSKIKVIHEGIDTEGLQPDPEARLILPNGNTLSAGDPVITYVARNLEPYRGFHQFMRALPEVLRKVPQAQILIVGGDGKSYGPLPEDAPNWKEKMLRELQSGEAPQLAPDWQPRVHFLGKVPYPIYKRILQISAVHVYLTYPFVLSWSLLEAMHIGCNIIASSTAPVKEVIADGVNGRLVDFFDQKSLAEEIAHSLAHPAESTPRREAARTSAANYSLEAGLTGYIQELLPEQQG